MNMPDNTPYLWCSCLNVNVITILWECWIMRWDFEIMILLNLELMRLWNLEDDLSPLCHCSSNSLSKDFLTKNFLKHKYSLMFNVNILHGSIFWLVSKIFLPQAFPKELPLPKGTFQQSPLKSHLLLVFKKTKERPVLTFADMLLCHLLKRKWTFVNIQSNSYINI